jgi:hypothetical protein
LTARPPVAAARWRRLPHPLTVVDAEREHPSTIGRIELVRAVVAAGQQSDLEADV